jgi:hypothetical protein
MVAGQLGAAAWSGSSRASVIIRGGGHLHDLFLAWRLAIVRSDLVSCLVGFDCLLLSRNKSRYRAKVRS